MKIVHKIINLLIQNKNKEYSIRKISQLIKTDYKNTYEAIKK